MKYLNFIFLPFLLIMHVNQVSAQIKNKIIITGKIEGFPKGSIIKLLALSGNIIDSSYLNNNMFVLHKNFDKEASPVKLVVFKDSMIASAELFLGNENVTIRGGVNDFPHRLKVDGSPDNKLMANLNVIMADIVKERQENLSMYLALLRNGKMNDSIKNTYWGQAGSIKMLDDEKLYREKKFIAANLNSYFALYLLAMLKAEYTKQELVDLLSRLNSTYKNSKYVYSITLSYRNKAIKVGDKFIDFKAFDGGDKPVLFSSYFNGKYVLLDFSTPYCQFCIQAIKPLKKVVQEKDSLLKIITFYVDEEKDGFASFLDHSKKPWSVVWDKQGRYGDAYSFYNVNTTPTFYLFDKNGVLIVKEEGFSNQFFNDVRTLIK